MASLLALPSEIRLMILEHILISPFSTDKNGYPEIWPYSTPTESNEDAQLYPQILWTCKKLYSEGTPILYSKNRFCINTESIIDDQGHFDGVEQARRFLHRIGDVNSSLLRRITVGGGAGMLKAETLQECLRMAGELTEFRVLCLGPCCQAPYGYMLQCYLNIQAAIEQSATRLTVISSAIPNGFVPDGLSVIFLTFQREKSPPHLLREDESHTVRLDESIAHFREKAREQEGEWAKMGWNLPIMIETTSGSVAFV